MLEAVTKLAQRACEDKTLNVQGGRVPASLYLPSLVTLALRVERSTLNVF
jgi:hypothetical protein